MKTRLLLACVFASSMFAIPQEVTHAPTLDSCTADLNLWTSQLPGWPTSTGEQDQEGTRSLTAHEITKRAAYLNDCGQAYPGLNKNRPGELSALASLGLIYESEIQRRLFRFLDRHGLYEKFTQENAAGKR